MDGTSGEEDELDGTSGDEVSWTGPTLGGARKALRFSGALARSRHWGRSGRAELDGSSAEEGELNRSAEASVSWTGPAEASVSWTEPAEASVAGRNQRRPR